MITDINSARRQAVKYLQCPILLVSADGSIFANCDLDVTCTGMESAGMVQGVDFFVINGQRSASSKKTSPVPNPSETPAS